MSAEETVPVLHNGTETSAVAALDIDLSGIHSKKQRYFLIAIAQSGEKGLTVGELREKHGARYHHGSSSGLLSTLHSRGLIVALAEPREGQTVYTLPEFVAGRETRPYRRQERERVRYDEDTLRRAYGAIQGLGYTPAEATDMVSAMQNAGILFRERA